MQGLSYRLAVLAAGWLLLTPMSAAGPMTGPAISGLEAVPLAFADLEGWAADDHAAAFGAFRRSCAAPDPGSARPAQAAPPGLAAICAAALTFPARPAAAEARAFFERHFRPVRLDPKEAKPGFLTGYFEPELPASRMPHPDYPAPLLARPDDLVTLSPEAASPPGLDGLSGARRRTDGTLVPYPDRAAIENGALGEAARAVAYLRDPVDAFMVHVQGSARLRLAGGEVLRVAFAGRNGHPYTSVGRLVVEAGHLTREEATADRLYAWLKAHPGPARDLMRRNRSYIFFRVLDGHDPALGPIGGAGVPLTPGRSLAVDRGVWSYGLPFWIAADLGEVAGGVESLRAHPVWRLVITQDTGSAIVGPLRGDLFVGSGEAAGMAAGRIRHPARLVVLWPVAGEGP